MKSTGKIITAWKQESKSGAFSMMSARPAFTHQKSQICSPFYSHTTPICYFVIARATIWRIQGQTIPSYIFKVIQNIWQFWPGRGPFCQFLILLARFGNFESLRTLTTFGKLWPSVGNFGQILPSFAFFDKNWLKLVTFVVALLLQPFIIFTPNTRICIFCCLFYYCVAFFILLPFYTSNNLYLLFCCPGFLWQPPLWHCLCMLLTCEKKFQNSYSASDINMESQLYL